MHSQAFAAVPANQQSAQQHLVASSWSLLVVHTKGTANDMVSRPSPIKQQSFTQFDEM